MLLKKMSAILNMVSQEQQAVYERIDRSPLDKKAKRMHKRSYQERLRRFSRI